jgi:hypothetical protein
VLTVDVIESVFTQIEIEQELDQLPKTQAHVMALIKAQEKSVEPLTHSLERGLAQVEDLPVLSAQGEWQEIHEMGETDLLLNIYQLRTRQVELSVDNGGSRSTGAWRSMTWFNPDDLSDFFNLTAVQSLGKDYARLAYSQALTWSLEWVYPWLRADDRSYTLTGAADAKPWQNTAVQKVLLNDKLGTGVTAQISSLYPSLKSRDAAGFYPDGEVPVSVTQLIQLDLEDQLESGIRLSTFYDWGQVCVQQDPSYPVGSI